MNNYFCIMEQEILSRDLIAQPERWRCALEIDRDSIEVAMLPDADADQLIHKSLPLRPNIPMEKAVQEAIYANPLLLSEFAQIDVLVDSPDFCIVPKATAQAVDAEQILATAAINLDRKSAEMCDATPECSIAFAINTPLAGFLRRTFFNFNLHHILAPIIANPPANNALFAAITPGKIILTATFLSKLLYANILRCENAEDATYFITAVSKNLPMKSLPVLISGQSEFARKVEQYLTRYLCAPEHIEIPSNLIRFGAEVTALPQPLTAFLSCAL
ncbi:MAG: DUF3822 family protein [Bacteroidales bacterium]|nr:DUF3822 family protein [Bacteroidales bacterium]MBD5240694.1 DUF3822 family protein [Barnesiella sp.]